MKLPVLNENAKKTAVVELMVHRRRAQKFYPEMKALKENADDSTAVLSFDYMQNLSFPNIPVLFPHPNIPVLFPLPNIPVQEIFYMRQLWVFTFCTRNIKNDRAKFYIYHEGQGRKSPEKACTFLLDDTANELPQKVNLILFSDSCGGQNKNHTLTRFLRNLSDNKIFENITQYFLIRGHSFLPCNRGFGNIKWLIRRFDRIYTPKQYARLITRVSKLNKFSVTMIDATYILSFKSWWPKKYKKKQKL